MNWMTVVQVAAGALVLGVLVHGIYAAVRRRRSR